MSWSEICEDKPPGTLPHGGEGDRCGHIVRRSPDFSPRVRIKG
jgi:hypothetical protein